MAAAYPFFGITYCALRSLYPAFLQSDLEGAAHDEPVLKQLGRWSSIALVFAVLAPLLSIGALLADKLIDPNLIHSEAELAMGFFCAVCLVGLLPIFWLYQSIQSDLTTFAGITAPHERPVATHLRSQRSSSIGVSMSGTQFDCVPLRANKKGSAGCVRRTQTDPVMEQVEQPVDPWTRTVCPRLSREVSNRDHRSRPPSSGI